MRLVLVIEDGDEYATFVRGVLSLPCEVVHSGEDALARARDARVFLVDLRFERVEPSALVGDLDETARTLFGGDATRALRHLQDEQGTYVLRALREAGHAQRAVFVHDFTPRRLRNLRALYGDVEAVASFDGNELRRLLA